MIDRMQRLLGAALLLAGSGHACAQAVFQDSFEDTRPTPEEAARFLQQATFGPTLESIDELRDMGYDAWIDWQVQDVAVSVQSDHLEWLESTGENPYQNNDGRVEAWMTHALVQPDQLRLRVAFALSQIFVVSDRLAAIGSHPETLADYYDMLGARAFGNYRELLEAVTLHPAMGHYLSMFRNRRADPQFNIRPDENYAREVMQLFSVGLVQLGPDGTPLLTPQGDTVPTYTQETIRGFAHVFTGWNWNGCEKAGSGGWEFCPQQWLAPMQPFEEYHSAEQKQLLVYPGVELPNGVLAAGGSAQADLDAALDNIFEHPNVGPFIARQLIQRLVTSNPSAGYVGDVAAVFGDDGHGVRGNLGAVVRAILLHDEARHGHETMPETFGKLREPLLRLTHFWRAMDASAQNGRWSEWYPEFDFSQAPLRSPSVFNFFLPGYAPPGEVAQAQFVAPEFQLMTDSGITALANGLGKRIYWSVPPVSADVITIDIARDQALATSVDALLDRYDLLFMAGAMPPSMRTLLNEHLASIDAGSPAGTRQRVQDALFLILTSPQYAVQK